MRPIAIEDLLGRDEVPADPQLLGPGIRDAVICVTGAGGSIGSELCRQILALSPSKLILLENSEAALYAIDQELRSLAPDEVSFQPVLGSATDSLLLLRLFTQQGVQLVFHAAAYKHVPLVEVNPLAGLVNNVISTIQVCRAAVTTGVRQVVVISTDKAVRPTNVMGASKRLAELVVQANATESSRTCFSMVRFGNVLGSSGSVVPLFRRQIAAGGPITLTTRISCFCGDPRGSFTRNPVFCSCQGGICSSSIWESRFASKLWLSRWFGLVVCLSVLSIAMVTLRLFAQVYVGEKLYEELLIGAESNQQLIRLFIGHKTLSVS